MQPCDVIVVGKGNAALRAALAARNRGVTVAMLEAASPDESGGNSRFAGGVMRCAYDNVEDLRKLTDEEARNADWESSTRPVFRRPLSRHQLRYRSGAVRNYPAGTDLVSVTMFGRIAGNGAAKSIGASVAHAIDASPGTR